MILLINTLMLSILCSVASELPSDFLALTDKVRPICDESHGCYVSQNKIKTKYQILFSVEEKDKAQWINEITVKDIKSKKQQSFVLPTPKAIFAAEVAPLYVTDINKDGYKDFALQAGLSNRKGFVYYYWVYNPKSKDFVFSKAMYPALRSTSKRSISSRTSKDTYKLDANYLLIEN